MAKIFRNYNTLAEFNSESVHPENKICFIKDNGVLYSNGVQYSFYKMDTISNMGDSDNAADKFNELRTNLLKSNLMVPRTPNTIIYYAGPSNTISISGTTYTAEPDKITIDGVEYYQVKLDKDLDDNFYKFENNTFSNLIFKDVDTSNITSMLTMFNGCKTITFLNLSEFNTSNVTKMGGMFNNCTALTSLDVSNFDTNNVTDMEYMFKSCMALTSLDVSNFNTSKVTSMKGMFDFCYKIIFLDVSGFDTSNVTNMSEMFSECTGLISLDLSGWDTSKVTNMNKMFKGCSALKTIRMVGCSQTTIDKIKAQLATDGITDCTIVTE